MTCIANIDIADSFVTGTVSGLLLLWTDRNCVRNIKGHQVCDSFGKLYHPCFVNIIIRAR
jgi:hypothetical protein